MSELSDRYDQTLGPWRPLLTGQRNQCRSCAKYFRSNAAFDAHRVGKFGVDRRCMTEDQLRAAGVVWGDDGFWRLPPSDGMTKWLERKRA